MTYAQQLPIIAAQHRLEMQAAERERAASRHRAHGVACAENRRIMLTEFIQRIANQPEPPHGR